MANSKLRPPPLITIIGATGTGKSQLAVDLALSLNGEVINGDAMQMYEGLDIVTNKITVEERRGVPHHLLGFLKTGDVFRVGQFVKEAEKTIEDIRRRKKQPILVGGTHYYLQSLLFPSSLSTAGTINTPDSDQEKLSSPVEEDLASKYPILNAPTPVLLEKLKSVDPVIASRWHPNDRRKIRRSLEIYFSTDCKQTASELYATQREQMQFRMSNEEVTASCSSICAVDARNESSSKYRNLIFWVHAQPDVLKKRLDDRVEKMVSGGIWEEIKQMEAFYESLGGSGNKNEGNEEVVANDGGSCGVDLNLGIWQSIGFKEFLPYLELRKQKYGDSKDGHDEGWNEKSESKELEELKALGIKKMKDATRRYARAQVKWIRIKFLNALRVATATEKRNNIIGENDVKENSENTDTDGIIYLLDSTDSHTYSETVSEPAINIAKTYLSPTACSLPNPITLSPLAAENLKPKREYDFSQRPDLWVPQKCELCGVSVTNESEWKQHIYSRKHKRLLTEGSRRRNVEMWKSKKREEILEEKERKNKDESSESEVVLGELIHILDEIVKKSIEKG